jgi:uncharacterized OB-fold protein
VSLQLPVCVSCGRTVFPSRALCPSCGGRTWDTTAAAGGVVEQSTERAGVRIAAVRTDLGPVVVARLEGSAGDGDAVKLDDQNGIPIAAGD